MAITTSLGQRFVPGARFDVVATITLDAAYPNPAGYVITPATFGLTLLQRLILGQFTTIAGASYELAIVPTLATDGSGNILSAAIHVVLGTTGVEVANGVTLTGVSFNLIASGS